MRGVILGQPVARSIRRQRDRLDVGLGAYTWRTAMTRATINPSVSNVKSAWAQLIAATAEDYDAIAIAPPYQSTIGSSAGVSLGSLIDVGIGGAGAEVVVVPDLNVGYWENFAGPLILPLAIPAGTRVAVRGQAANAAISYDAAIAFGKRLELNRRAPASLVTYGANPANSGGVALDLSGGAGAESAWTQIVAATDRPLAGFLPLAGVQNDSTLGAGVHLVDIALGAAGAEVPIVTDFPVETTTAEIVRDHHPMTLGIPIPLGARIAARIKLAEITTTNMTLTILGIPLV